MGKFLVLLIFCMYFVYSNGRYFEDEDYNRYDISFDEITVDPICYPKCQNDGICDANNMCQCPKNFGGVLCELEKTRNCYSFETEKEFCNSVEIDEMKACDRYCYYYSSERSTITEVPTTREDETTPISEEEYTTQQNEIFTDTTEDDVPDDDDKIESRMMVDLFKIEKKSDECPYEPPLSENARQVLLNPGRYWKVKKYQVICFPGFSFPDGSTYKYFECMAGTWYTTGGGFYVTEDCQKDPGSDIVILEPNGCPFEPLISKNAKHMLLDSGSKTKYKVECFPGYKFTDNSTIQYLNCKEDGKWHYELSGESDEAQDCYYDYLEASYNEKKKKILESFGCPFEPSLSKNAKHILINDHSTKKYKVQCLPGFAFADGSNVQYLDCKDDGNWHHEPTGASVAPDCHEVNTETTKPKNFEKEKSNEILEGNGCVFEPPIVENAKHIYVVIHGKTKYKIQCFKGYSFADGSKEQYLECADGKWYHKESGLYEVPRCQAIQCEYDGKKFNSNYQEVRPGKEFLELCVCKRDTWNCSEAVEGDLQNYPSSSNSYENDCAENPNSCKIKTSNYELQTSNCTENSEKYQSINNTNSLMEMIKFALGVRSEAQRNNTIDNKYLPHLKENNEIPGVKVVSLNLQVVEIEGSSSKNKEKALH